MSLPGGEQVDDDDGDGDEHDPDEDDVGIGELVLADDPRGPDAEPGDDEDENGSDQYEEHGE